MNLQTPVTVNRNKNHSMLPSIYDDFTKRCSHYCVIKENASMHAVPTTYKNTKTARDRTTGTGSSVHNKKTELLSRLEKSMELRLTPHGDSCHHWPRKKQEFSNPVNSIAFALEMYATLYKRSQVETALVHVYEIASGHLTNARLARPYPPLALQKWTRSCTSYELYLNKCSSFSLPQ